MVRIVSATIFLLLLPAPGGAWAQGEHARRAAVELLVLDGDLRRLQHEELTAAERLGLERRVRGALAVLPMLLKKGTEGFNFEQSILCGKPPQSIDCSKLNPSVPFSPKQLSAQVQSLLPRFPLVLPDFAPADANTLAASLKLHQALCAACHDAPATGMERPAYNLFEQVRSQSELEFYARMFTGVKGDRLTGIDNPLSDFQIVGLVELYKN